MDAATEPATRSRPRVESMVEIETASGAAARRDRRWPAARSVKDRRRRQAGRGRGRPRRAGIASSGQLRVTTHKKKEWVGSFGRTADFFRR